MFYREFWKTLRNNFFWLSEGSFGIIHTCKINEFIPICMLLGGSLTLIFSIYKLLCICLMCKNPVTDNQSDRTLTILVIVTHIYILINTVYLIFGESLYWNSWSQRFTNFFFIYPFMFSWRTSIFKYRKSDNGRWQKQSRLLLLFIYIQYYLCWNNCVIGPSTVVLFRDDNTVLCFCLLQKEKSKLKPNE